MNGPDQFHGETDHPQLSILANAIDVLLTKGAQLQALLDMRGQDHANF